MLQGGAPGYDPVFDFCYRKLDFEIARMRFRQFLRANENWLQASQFRDLVDLLF